MKLEQLQSWAKERALGCVNSPSILARGSLEAGFTQPRAQPFDQLCRSRPKWYHYSYGDVMILYLEPDPESDYMLFGNKTSDMDLDAIKSVFYNTSS